VVGKVALGGLAVMSATGAWLVAAPFVMRYQPEGAPWTGAAGMDVAVGTIVAAAGLAGFLAALAGRVRELYADRGAPAGHAPAGHAAAGHAPAGPAAAGREEPAG
jgi:hypothetical protein